MVPLLWSSSWDMNVWDKTRTFLKSGFNTGLYGVRPVWSNATRPATPVAKPQLWLCFSSAWDRRTGAQVAIKKLLRPFQSKLFAKRAYRELRLLKHMKHENVGSIRLTYSGRKWHLSASGAKSRSLSLGHWAAGCFHCRDCTGPVKRLVST